MSKHSAEKDAPHGRGAETLAEVSPEVRRRYGLTAEYDAPCCNMTEPDGILCHGTMRAGWPTFRCDTCGAYCGAAVHPTHILSPERTGREGGSGIEQSISELKDYGPGGCI